MARQEGYEGPLAEFVALRAEILHTINSNIRSSHSISRLRVRF
jgi:hypothetical protein